MDDLLSTALDLLDKELERRELLIEITICDAYAIQLLGLE